MVCMRAFSASPRRICYVVHLCTCMHGRATHPASFRRLLAAAHTAAAVAALGSADVLCNLGQHGVVGKATVQVVRRVKDALWRAEDEQGRLALHLAVQRQHWGSVELLLSRHEPDLHLVGYDGQRLVDVLRDTPAADTACVRQVLADEAYNELLAGATSLSCWPDTVMRRCARVLCAGSWVVWAAASVIC